jgi:hypothetical protein
LIVNDRRLRRTIRRSFSPSSLDRSLLIADRCLPMSDFRERYVLASRRDEIEAATANILSALERLGYDKAAVFACACRLKRRSPTPSATATRTTPAVASRSLARFVRAMR